MFDANPDDDDKEAVTAPPETVAPHDPQNAVPSATVAPHFEQIAISCLLLRAKNFAKLVFPPEGPSFRPLHFLVTNPS